MEGDGKVKLQPQPQPQPPSPNSDYFFTHTGQLDHPKPSPSNMSGQDSRSTMTSLSNELSAIVSYSSNSEPVSQGVNFTRERESGQEAFAQLYGSSAENEVEVPKCIVDAMASESTSSQIWKPKRRAAKSTSSTVVVHQSHDDGYHWRKYGQKDILGKKYPRMYYRCTRRNSSGCHATKMTERLEGSELIKHTYRGQHNHQEELAELLTDELDDNVPHAKRSIADARTTKSASSSIARATKSTSLQMGVDELLTDEFEYGVPCAKRRIVDARESESEVIVTETKEVDLMDYDYRRSEYEQRLVQGNPNPRDDDVSRVIKLMVSSDECMEHGISGIHIVGVGGVGKTFFASVLYNNSIVCDIFERRAWVSANERLDVFGLAKKVIEAFAGVSCNLTELTEIQEALREELIDKRFLLVIDNVSNDQLNIWSSMLAQLSVSARGSLVLTTSRNEIMTIELDMVQSYKLNQMSKRDCWLLVHQHLLDNQDLHIHVELKEIGMQIVNWSEGLPLAVKAIVGVLRSNISEQSWNAIIESQLWDKEDQNLPALRFSYEHLTEYLKKCFVYCSLFPKGYIFEKHLLVRLWMSQDFIEHEEGKPEQDIGNEYFDELLNRSFFQLSPNCGPKDKKYVIHDLFYHLAQSLPVNNCFRTKTCNLSNVQENVDHLALVPDRLDSEVQFETFKEPRDIRSLLLVSRSDMKQDANIFHVENPAILNKLLFQLRCLRTLDLSFTNIEVVPESISNLQDLRYLALIKTNIDRLPESICSLHNLQTLELQDCTYLSELPARIKELANLLHLDVRKEPGFVRMPPGIGQLTGLLSLPVFTISNNDQCCGIRELKDMMNLRGSLCIGGIWNVVSSEEAKEAKLEMKKHLRTLTLQWFNCSEDLKGYQSAETAFEVLHNLQPHSMLEKLTIRDYAGNCFPEWIANPSFSMLSSITIENCYECNILPPLGQLPSLKYLSIRMMDGVQCVGNEFRGSVPGSVFPSLETLKLLEMFELEIWCEVKPEDFPSLIYLTISRCDKLKGLPCFHYLEELSVHCCAELSALPNLPRLKTLKLEGLPNLETFPCAPDLPELRFLEISNCNQLSSLGDLHDNSSLEKMKVIRCPKLQVLPNEKLPLNLQSVEIGRGCTLLSDWCPHGFEEIASARQVSRKLVRQAAGPALIGRQARRPPRAPAEFVIFGAPDFKLPL